MRLAIAPIVIVNLSVTLMTPLKIVMILERFSTLGRIGGWRENLDFDAVG
jgi:hypothetical protein